MTASRDTVAPENAALLEHATEYALDAVAHVTEGDLDRPTPCTNWKIRDLLLHLADVADALSKLADTGTLELVAQQRPETDTMKVVRDRTHLFLDRLNAAAGVSEPSSAAGSEWANNAAISGAVEFITHGWDIHTALGESRQIPDALAQTLLKITSEAIDNASRDPQFAPPVNIDPSQPPSDQLLGFLGRNPHPSMT